ncbi:protein ABHD18 isoform X2 [Condylostylus longicornis]|nr:protein ABHD18 isoform X2 [Condylostylus longicornis]
MPKELHEAHFQVILPNKWKSKHKPMCLHLAGTGDHYFWRRRNLIAKPLLREANIGAILLENPFYGIRKPEGQIRSNLHNVSDIFVMGGCLILESLVLLHWCEKNSFGPLGVTGLSMGGHMASLAATNWPKPLVLVPCLSWSTASSVFTQGVMSQSINWDKLETQYYSDGNYKERLSKMVHVVDDAFIAGQKFVKNFNRSMKELRSDIMEIKTLEKQSNLMCISPAEHNDPNIIQLDEKNVLGLSQSLHNKLMSKNRYELSNTEINELNQKIKLIQAKIRQKKQKNELQKFYKNDQEPAAVSISQNKELQKNDSSLTRLMSYILPTSSQDKSKHERIDTKKIKWWEREALQFMRGVMDECTHLKNFSVPYDTSLIIAVCAKDDAYIPRDGCTNLEDIWPGAEVRYLDAGHVSAYVLHQKLFRSCIAEAFERAKKKAEQDDYFMDCENLKSEITFAELKAKYEKTINM